MVYSESRLRHAIDHSRMTDHRFSIVVVREQYIVPTRIIELILFIIFVVVMRRIFVHDIAFRIFDVICIFLCGLLTEDLHQ